MPYSPTPAGSRPQNLPDVARRSAVQAVIDDFRAEHEPAEDRAPTTTRVVAGVLVIATALGAAFWLLGRKKQG